MKKVFFFLFPLEITSIACGSMKYHHTYHVIFQPFYYSRPFKESLWTRICFTHIWMRIIYYNIGFDLPCLGHLLSWISRWYCYCFCCCCCCCRWMPRVCKNGCYSSIGRVFLCCKPEKEREQTARNNTALVPNEKLNRKQRDVKIKSLNCIYKLKMTKGKHQNQLPVVCPHFR